MPHTAGYHVRPVKVSAHIPAPPEELIRFVADTRNDTLWCPNVERADLVEPWDSMRDAVLTVSPQMSYWKSPRWSSPL